MRRILPIHCPTVRSTVGSSFGPITMSATTPMMTSLPQLMSNMGFYRSLASQMARPIIHLRSFPRKRESSLSKAGSPLSRGRAAKSTPAAGLRSGGRAFDALLGVGARLHRGRGVVVVDHLHAVRFGRIGLGNLVVRHALFERLDALRDVAHQLGDFSAPEQQQNHRD